MPVSDIYEYMYIMDDVIVPTGSEKQMRDIQQNYLKGDWNFPWARCESDEEDSGKRKLGMLVFRLHYV